MMNKISKFGFAIVFLLGVALIIALWMNASHLAVLNPAGLIASKERTLIFTALLLMLIVVIPVFILTIVIAWRYRAGNGMAKYTPDWDHDNKLEAIWWGLPCAIILVLAIVAWNASHALDPFKPIDSAVRPMTIQVIALQYKWLFLYPEQNIATVNYVQFPKNTPINFQITADAPMNSFWIPQLGGQIYAMPGMSTQLHLIADQNGSFAGSSANISGVGFADMHFTAKATSEADFQTWVASVKQSPNTLSQNDYTVLAQPGSATAPLYYASEEHDLYDKVILKFMGPGHTNHYL